MKWNKPEDIEIRLATDLLLLLLLLALLALPTASLGLSGVQEGAKPQVAGTSHEAPDYNITSDDAWTGSDDGKDFRQ